MIVKIPFHKRFIIEIAAGRKTMTTRSSRKGKIGDVFYIRRKFPVVKCMITGIEKMQIFKIIMKFYRQEGFNTPREFEQFFRSIYPRISFNREFYLHTFIRI